MRKLLLAAFVLGMVIALVNTAALAAEPEILLNDPLVQVANQNGLESCAFPAGAYSDFTLNGKTARFTIDTPVSTAETRTLRGKGVHRISWQPGAESTTVEIEFATEPEYYVINAMPSTELKPGVPQVIAAFSFPSGKEKRYPVMGSHPKSAGSERDDEHGTYDLPKLPPAKYSDALVTLNVRNTDFRDVLWLMSDIGGVSIMLDPYWDQEPTGGTRRPGGIGPNNGGSGNGGSGGGFRPGGQFNPPVPRDGTGSLTLSFKDVPFDTALDLILMAVGLVKVDIYPGEKV